MLLSIFVWIVLPILLLVTGCYIDHYIGSDYSLILQIISALILISALLITPLNRLDMVSKVSGIEQVRTTIEQARQNSSQIELAALQTQILEYNKWIAENKFAANLPTLRLFFPKSIYTVEYLK